MRGKPFQKGYDIRRNTKVSEQAKNKIRIAKIGSKNAAWKGGVTPINRIIRTSSEYRIWKKAVKERDGFRCVWCGSEKELHADHIKPFALFPELRFAIDNGRTLCMSCHKKTSTWGSIKKVKML